jgi:hypothetical protein
MMIARDDLNMHIIRWYELASSLPYAFCYPNSFDDEPLAEQLTSRPLFSQPLIGEWIRSKLPM